MLEPLFRCNLACVGCGKIDYPEEILDKRLRVSACLSAVDECDAPVVSIAGGEPLLHEDMPQIVEEIIKRKKFVYLCTNGLLLKNQINKYEPTPYFTFSVHLDGNRERHDLSVCREGVFDVAVEGIRYALAHGFRVTINCTLYKDVTAKETAEFFEYISDFGIEGITLTSGFSYEKVPCKGVFLNRTVGKKLFREIFELGKGRGWKFNHTGLYLDFLAGNQTYQCTPWGNPTYNIFGWQRPCYLLNEGYAASFKKLVEETDWNAYGLGRNPKCANCMLHSGFEATAVKDMFAHPVKAIRMSLIGARTSGPLAEDLALVDRKQIGVSQSVRGDQ
jgi:hopanoid biosynthesis associated radical SAM protein HpnH